ncbi:Protein of unknown function, partial [Gryllus bimaculatus]
MILRASSARARPGPGPTRAPPPDLHRFLADLSYLERAFPCTEAERACLEHGRLLHADGNCYRVREQGPCAAGEVFRVNKTEALRGELLRGTCSKQCKRNRKKTFQQLFIINIKKQKRSRKSKHILYTDGVPVGVGAAADGGHLRRVGVQVPDARLRPGAVHARAVAPGGAVARRLAPRAPPPPTASTPPRGHAPRPAPAGLLQGPDLSPPQR